MSDVTYNHQLSENMLDSKTSSPAMEREKTSPSIIPVDDLKDTTYPKFSGDLPWSQRSWLYQLLPFRGMYYDFRRRAPFFASDWTTAFYPQNWWTVAQYIPRMYFINLMPAISYIIDMNHRTGGSYGLNEVILASALAAIVFPILSIQPLTFVGVTGLINLVNYTQYDLVVGYYGLDRIDYLRVQAWSLIWAAGFHFVISIFNVCDFTRFITDMTSSTFGFYVGIVYIQKGIELLLLEFEPFPLDNATGWLSVTIAILFTVSVYLVTAIGKTSFLPFKMRYFVSSFAFAAGCIFWTGFSHFPKNSLKRVPIERLPITRSFFPTLDRSWFIDFWNIEARWAFVGAPLGFLIMLLFYFDHNVSSVMAQARQFPVKRPAGFHWDFFLLGITTLVSGLLGLPAPNGLVPQCPWSTEALSVYEQVEMLKNDQEEKPLLKKEAKYLRHHIVNSRVVENRVGHLIVGLLTLGTMTRPLLVVLGTMPRAIFAGIFLLVGWSSIEGNPITTRTLAIFKDRHLGSINDGLGGLKRKKIALFVGIQWIFFAMTIAISQTIAAIGFPVIFMLLIPFRYYIVPKWFSPAELRVLDAPTADADVVLASIGQETEAVTGHGQKVARDTGIAGTEWRDESDDDDEDEDSRNVGMHGTHGKQREAQSDAPGYTINGDDDDDDDEDQVEVEAVRPTDVIAHMTDLGGGNAAAEGQPEKERGGVTALAALAVNAIIPDKHKDGEDKVDEEKTDEIESPQAMTGNPVAAPTSTTDAVSSSSSPTKNNKRNKSATQSWWGLGGSKAVERAPSPHTPVTPLASDAPEATIGPTATSEEGSGLKRFLNNKKKEDTSGTVSEEGFKESPITAESAAVVDVNKMALEQHFAAHYAATGIDLSKDPGASTVAPPVGGVTPAAATTVSDTPLMGAAGTSFAEKEAVEKAPGGVGAGDAQTETKDKNLFEKASDKIDNVLGGSESHSAKSRPASGSTREIVPVEGAIVSDKPTSSVVAPNTAVQGNSKAKTEAEEAATAAASAAAMTKITDDYKQKEKNARDARVAALKKKEDDKLKAKEDKKKAKADKEAAKKQAKADKETAKKAAKEDKKKRKEEVALLEKQEKEKAERSKREAKEAKLAKQRAEEKAVVDKKHAEDKAAADKKLAEQKVIADKAHADQMAREEQKRDAAKDHSDKGQMDKEVGGVTALAALAVNAVVPHKQEDGEGKGKRKAVEDDSVADGKLHEGVTDKGATTQSTTENQPEKEAGGVTALVALAVKGRDKGKGRAVEEESEAGVKPGQSVVEKEGTTQSPAHKESEKEAVGVTVLPVIPNKHRDEEDKVAEKTTAAEIKPHDGVTDKEAMTPPATLSDQPEKERGGITALAAVAVGALFGKKHHDEEKSDGAIGDDKAVTEPKSAAVTTSTTTSEVEGESVAAKPLSQASAVQPVGDVPSTNDQTRSADFIAPVIIPIDTQAEEKKAAEEERARKIAEEEQAKKVAEEEQAREAAEEEKARKTAEEEQSRKAAEEAAAKKKAEEEAALASLANEKAALEKDLAEVQARKDKELSDLEESKKAKEKESAENKKKEEAALALLIADRKKTEDEIASRKEQEEKEAAERKEKDEKEAAERREKDEKEATERKEKEEKESSERKEREEKEAADRKEREEKEALERKDQQDKEMREVAAKKEELEKETAARKEKEAADLAKTKKEKLILEAEIAALEAKALSARSYLAPAKVSKSSLTALSGQVAGHDKGVYTLAGESLVVKSCTPSESSFYQNILIHQTATTQKSQLELLSRLRKYLPTYHGTIQLTSDDDSTDAASAGEMAVILQNLTRGYKHANVLDIKLGKQMWDEGATAEKKQRMAEAAKSSTSGETGIRLTGWQVWSSDKDAFIKVDKKFGKTVKSDQLYLGLRSYFGATSKDEAVKISELAGEEVPSITLPEKPIERILHDAILPAIKEIIDIIKKLEWRVRGGSLLIVYEGDVAELSKINAKTPLEAGRSLTDTDQFVDTSNLNDAKVPNTSRLVDVRLIDFAHASFASEKGADEGYLAGLETSKRLIEDLYKGLHKGKLHAHESGQGDNILKTSGGAVLLGSITGLFSRDKGESQTVSKDDKDTSKTVSKDDKETSKTAVPAPYGKDTKEDTKPAAAPASKEETEMVEVGGAGVALAVAATAVGKKSSKSKKEAEKPKSAKSQPEQSLVANKGKGEPKVKQGGFMSLFSARLVSDDGKKVATSKPAKSKPAPAVQLAPNLDSKPKSKSFEIIRTGQPKKELKEKTAADGSALATPISAAEIAKVVADVGKVKGKEKETETETETSDKLKPFWKVTEPEVQTEDEDTASPTKSTGPRKLIRHENPRKGPGRGVPAVQFRAPE